MLFYCCECSKLPLPSQSNHNIESLKYFSIHTHETNYILCYPQKTLLLLRAYNILYYISQSVTPLTLITPASHITIIVNKTRSKKTDLMISLIHSCTHLTTKSRVGFGLHAGWDWSDENLQESFCDKTLIKILNANDLRCRSLSIPITSGPFQCQYGLDYCFTELHAYPKQTSTWRHSETAYLRQRVIRGC